MVNLDTKSPLFFNQIQTLFTLFFAFVWMLITTNASQNCIPCGFSFPTSYMPRGTRYYKLSDLSTISSSAVCQCCVHDYALNFPEIECKSKQLRNVPIFSTDCLPNFTSSTINTDNFEKDTDPKREKDLDQEFLDNNLIPTNQNTKNNPRSRQTLNLNKNGLLAPSEIRVYLDFNGQHNGITRIDVRSFACLPNLRVIRLQHNYIGTIETGAFDNNIFLDELDLSHNFLTEITNSTFSGLKFLKRLNLGHNQIFSIPSGTFANMPFLESFHLNANPLKLIAFDTLVGNEFLRHLDLSQIYPASHMSLKHSISPYNKTAETLLPPKQSGRIKNLKILRETNGPKLVTVMEFFTEHIFERLLGIGFAGSQNFDALVDLNVSYNGLTHLLSSHQEAKARLPTFVSEGFGTNLETLDLSGNTFDSSNLTAFLLVGGPNKFNQLKRLKLNHLPNLTFFPADWLFFAHHRNYLPKLKKLEINHCSNLKSFMVPQDKHIDILSAINRHNPFQKSHESQNIDYGAASNLEEINIQNNSLTTLDGQLFERLFQDGNSISTNLTPFSYKTLKKIDLSFNPWVCDCKIAWFLQLTRVVQNSDAINTKCHKPAHLKGQVIFELHPEDFTCYATTEEPKTLATPVTKTTTKEPIPKVLTDVIIVTRTVSSDSTWPTVSITPEPSIADINNKLSANANDEPKSSGMSKRDIILMVLWAFIIKCILVYLGIWLHREYKRWKLRQSIQEALGNQNNQRPNGGNNTTTVTTTSKFDRTEPQMGQSQLSKKPKGGKVEEEQSFLIPQITIQSPTNQQDEIIIEQQQNSEQTRLISQTPPI